MIRLSSVFLLFTGALWVWWLSALSAASADPRKKCRDVMPGLRTVLYLMTSILLLLLVCACIATMAGSYGTVGEKTEGVIILGVVIAMAAVQLSYLQAVRFSEQSAAEDCTLIARASRQTLIVIAAVFILAGAIGIFDGLSRDNPAARSTSTRPGKGTRASRASSRGSRGRASRANRSKK